MLKVGDILGFSGSSLVSDVINAATWGIPRWSISHVGVVGEAAGRLLLFESTTLNGLPDELSGKPFNGTQTHDLDKVLAAYKGRVWLYPLYRPLFDFESQRLSEFLTSHLHVPYDEIGAFRSAGFGPVESILHPENLNSIFCSEYVAAALREIGIMPTDDASKWSPNALVRFLRRREVLLRPRRLK